MELEVNGATCRVAAAPRRSLLSAVRDELGLTGAKPACGEGACGACTVLVDRVPVRACVTPLERAAGRQVTTIEGLERGERLHPVQQAFVDEGALQCGYCTPGMVMAAVGLLNTAPAPSDAEIRAFMEGNLCRCGAYGRIVAAIRRAAATTAD